MDVEPVDATYAGLIPIIWQLVEMLKSRFPIVENYASLVATVLGIVIVGVLSQSIQKGFQFGIVLGGGSSIYHDWRMVKEAKREALESSATPEVSV